MSAFVPWDKSTFSGLLHNHNSLPICIKECCCLFWQSNDYQSELLSDCTLLNLVLSHIENISLAQGEFRRSNKCWTFPINFISEVAVNSQNKIKRCPQKLFWGTLCQLPASHNYCWKIEMYLNWEINTSFLSTNCKEEQVKKPL